MSAVVIVLLLGIVVLLWRSSSQASKLIEVIEAQNRITDRKWRADLTNKDYLDLIYRRICSIDDFTAQIVSIATKENPAGANFHEYVRSDNLASLYAPYLERYESLPQHLAIKRARFEVTKFGQDAVIKKINTDYKNGIRQQREQNDFNEFFSSGIIEKDIESRLEKKISASDLFAPIYDLIVKQGYLVEAARLRAQALDEDFAAVQLTHYTIKSYDEMVDHAAIILRLEQLGILLRTSGENWGAFLTFRLKSTDASELKRLIYSGGSSVDDKYFEEQFREGRLPRVFDAHHTELLHRRYDHK